MYYLGFLKRSPEHVVIFKSIKKPLANAYRYLVKVMGPYASEGLARGELAVLRREYRYVENPVKNRMSVDKALKLTKKVIDFSKDIHKTYKENPGAEYHDRKFLLYMRDLEKYAVGSKPYIITLAKAYEHLESAKDSGRVR